MTTFHSLQWLSFNFSTVLQQWPTWWSGALTVACDIPLWSLGVGISLCMCGGFVAAVIHEQKIPPVSGGHLIEWNFSLAKGRAFWKEKCLPNRHFVSFPHYTHWVYQGVPRISAPFPGHYPTQIAASWVSCEFLLPSPVSDQIVLKQISGDLWISFSLHLMAAIS